MATFNGNVTGGGLNLRTSPSTSSNSPIQIPSGTSLTVSTISGNQEWFSTSYGGYSGYVVAQYVAITADGGTCTVTTSSGSLNIRKSASTSAAVVYTAAKGSTLRLLDNTSVSGWYRVSNASGTGWASANYLTVVNNPGGGNSGGGDSGGNGGLQSNRYIQVSSNYNSVNVRQTTDSQSTKLGVLMHGTKAYCTQVVNNNWVKIIWGGKNYSEGFIMSQFLVDGGAAASTRALRAVDIAISMQDSDYPYDGKIGNLGLSSDNWCVQYCSWLMKAVGCLSYPNFSSQATVQAAMQYFQNLNKYGDADSKIPAKGDWVFYKKTGSSSSNPGEYYYHVGMVVDKSGDNILTVEGNLSSTITSPGWYNYKTATTIGNNNFTVIGFGTPTWS